MGQCSLDSAAGHRMSLLTTALLALAVARSALGQQGGQQGFIDSLIAQGFTEDQINGFLASQQNRQQQQQQQQRSDPRSSSVSPRTAKTTASSTSRCSTRLFLGLSPTSCPWPPGRTRRG